MDGPNGIEKHNPGIIERLIPIHSSTLLNTIHFGQEGLAKQMLRLLTTQEVFLGRLSPSHT